MQDLFNKYQRLLIKYVNSSYGRRRLEIPDMWKRLPCVQVGVNHATFYLGGNDFIGKFWVGDNMVAKRLGEALTSIDIIHDNSFAYHA